jgi:hypothetical protein
MLFLGEAFGVFWKSLPKLLIARLIHHPSFLLTSALEKLKEIISLNEILHFFLFHFACEGNTNDENSLSDIIHVELIRLIIPTLHLIYEMNSQG